MYVQSYRFQVLQKAFPHKAFTVTFASDIQGITLKSRILLCSLRCIIELWYFILFHMPLVSPTTIEGLYHVSCYVHR